MHIPKRQNLTLSESFFGNFYAAAAAAAAAAANRG
jgi:hypothetical protein